MRSFSFKTAFVLLLIGTGIHCKHDSVQGPVLTGKLVISNGCGMNTIQVLSGNVDPSTILSAWNDPDNDSIYHNVFAVSSCGFASAGIQTGGTFTFRIVSNPPGTPCNPCAIGPRNPSYPPKVNYVDVIQH